MNGSFPSIVSIIRKFQQSHQTSVFLQVNYGNRGLFRSALGPCTSQAPGLIEITSLLNRQIHFDLTRTLHLDQQFSHQSNILYLFEMMRLL